MVILPGCTSDSPPGDDVAPAESRQTTPFLQCVEDRDRKIHQEVFATVDNPDVQRELLITRKEQAMRMCREQFPVDSPP